MDERIKELLAEAANNMREIRKLVESTDLKNQAYATMNEIYRLERSIKATSNEMHSNVEQEKTQKDLEDRPKSNTRDRKASKPEAYRPLDYEKFAENVRKVASKKNLLFSRYGYIQSKPSLRNIDSFCSDAKIELSALFDSNAHSDILNNKSDLVETFWVNVVDLMNENNLTISALADMLGLANSTVQTNLSKRGNATMMKVEQYAKAFKVHPYYLLSDH